MKNSDKAAICTAGNAVEMSLDERFAVMRSIGLESNDEDDVRMLLEKKVAPICYVWCDPSPCVHIAQGIIMVNNVTKMVKAGCRVKILIADWFAHIQNKFGGDLNKIRTIGCYMIEIWKAAGLELNKVEFVWLSDEINSHSDEYWTLVMDIARNNTLRRITRSYGIVEPRMVDGELIYPYVLEELMTSMLFYPCMHCAGILFQQYYKETGQIYSFKTAEWTFQNMEELITDYESGALHSTEVKLALTEALNKILNKIMKTVRGHFTDKSKVKDLGEATKEYYRGALLR